MGLSIAIISRLSAGLPLISAASGESPSLGPLQLSIRAISMGPNQSTTAFTVLLNEVYSPTLPSMSTVVSFMVYSLTLLVAPASEARCPPDEKPVIPIKDSSILYFAAFALINLMAAFTSFI